MTRETFTTVSERKERNSINSQISQFVNNIVYQNQALYSDRRAEIEELQEELEKIAKEAISKGEINTSPEGKMQSAKAANGNLSNLSVEDWLVTKTKRFQKWFEGSKIVDENGEPFIAYHGGVEKVREWDKTKIGSSSNDEGHIGNGFYFGNKQYAQGYEKGFLGAYYIRAKNPFMISVIEGDPKRTNIAFIEKLKNLKGVDATLISHLKTNSDDDFYLSELIVRVIGSKRFTEILKLNGYDASCSQLVSEDTKTAQKAFKSNSKFRVESDSTVSTKDRFIEITAFEPDQIKSKENLFFSSDTNKVYE